MKKKILIASLAVSAAVCGAFGLAACGDTEHRHSLTFVEGKDATCLNGNIAYYVCDGCGEWFEDENAETRITDKSSVIIQKLPHNYVDGVCTGCHTHEPTAGLEYKEYDDYCAVSGIGEATATEIYLPYEYNGKLVTTVESGAFEDCTAIKSIIIPYNITSVANGAFSGCSGLESITVDGENTKYHVDGNCLIETGTKTIILGCKNSVIPSDESVTAIGASAFNGCIGLTNVNIPANVTSIAAGAFSGCSGIENITLADENTKYHIDGNCLIETSSKTLVLGCKNSVIPADESVTSIGASAFSGCIGLTNLTIPANVTSIAAGAFSGCSGIESITLAGENTKYHVDGNCLIETSSKTLVLGCKNSVIPADGSVTSIGTSAFNGSGLTDITIPEKVTSIGVSAFYKCTNLTSITIGSGVTSIGATAFYECIGLTEITIPVKVTTVSSSAFEGCVNIVNATLPAGAISTIPADSLKTFTINSGTIGGSAFANFKELTSVTFGDGLEGIVNTAFKDATHLIQTENGVQYVDTWILACDTQLSQVSIKANTKGIADGAFSGCDKLTGITLPDGLLVIGSESFSGCSALTGIVIPDSVRTLGRSAFEGCVSIKTATIGNGVTVIGSTAFSGCSALESVVIGNSVTAINERAFYQCGSLTSITIPDSVKTIGVSVFSECSRLSNAIIGNGVTSIGDRAFWTCGSLSSVTIGSNVKTIGDGTFFECKNLKSIEFKNTKANWGAISKGFWWNKDTGSYKVHCTDGDVSK